MPQGPTAEHRRLAESQARRADWKNWGPYVAERAWGTVREDYSPDGDAWNSFPHDHARSRAYRWNEDGLAGFCNRFQNLCMAIALWNGRDPILKERLFGLSGPEGNHGEDVKEYYYYLDATPTHSFLRMLYKYPQVEFPYARLIEENARRDRSDREFELFDAIGDAFRAGRYFDVFIEYAKVDQEDILCRVTAINRGPEPAPLHVLPHVWFRNSWSWGYSPDRPELRGERGAAVRVRHKHLGERWWYADVRPHAPELRFTENETNHERLFGVPCPSPYVKDAFHEAVIHGRADRVNPDRRGTKAAAHYRATVGPGEAFVVRTRLADRRLDDPFDGSDATFDLRRREADEFYNAVQKPGLTDDERHVQRQALAGLLWSKQFYHYSVELWLRGDPAGPPPPDERTRERNADWGHFTALDVLSVPDKWEYPWFAAWDLAFHCIPLARVDPEWAKRQLVLLLREWYMHPNGQLPAYEWDFGDVNPPVHAHAARRIYEIERAQTGRGDAEFLEEVFHKLLLYFTWWVNRKDAEGKNAFQGGFLGMDNIGLFDRSRPPDWPGGGRLEQADGTAWMGRFCLGMLAIALELSRTRPAYEAMATKFFEHFVAIAQAINGICGKVGMWNEADRFYYDVIRRPEGAPQHLRVRSVVGLVPLFGTLAIAPDIWERLPRFRRRVAWYLKYRPVLASHACLLTEPGAGGYRLMTIVDRAKLEAVLARVLDPAQFLSDYGLRSLSKEHAAAPYECHGQMVAYEPAESSSPIYGGNSNWRGPIWFPVNYALIQALREYHRYFGATLRVELPAGSGRRMDLGEVADELSRRLVRLFLQDESRGGRRPVFGDNLVFQADPHWRDHIPFHEYFHGDNGAGLGASHQTGWTALVAELIGWGDGGRGAK
ncbi:MAG TPA: glucosidase [Isosphaeraceae bacterium]|nr:glucosidase [Isosphaeraceae bacterium]